MNFLATYNFDFNKMVQQGIPYVSAEKEEFLLTRVKERKGNDLRIKSCKFYLSAYFVTNWLEYNKMLRNEFNREFYSGV